MTNVKIPYDLIDAIRKNECVLFVASGLSSQIRRSDGRFLPNWTAFLTELLEWSKYKRVSFNSDPIEIEEMIEKGNHIMAGEELQSLLNSNEIGEFLNSIFRDPEVKPNSVHEKLTHIPFRAILTTNYDSLLEGAYTISSGGRTPKTYTPKDINSLLTPLRNKDFFIFKLHGDLDRPEDIVLGSRSYNDLLYKSPEYLSFLEILFTTQTVLFIGFGGSDPDLDYLLGKLSTIFSRTLSKHFILSPKDKFNFTEKRRLLLDKRLEVIEYNPENNHKGVENFVTQLSKIIELQNEWYIEKSEINLMIVQDLLKDIKNDIIINILEDLDGYRLTRILTFDSLLDFENEEDFDEDLSEEEGLQPSIAIIRITEESLSSISFEDCIEHLLLNELENKLSILLVTIGEFELPIKLRKFQAINLPIDYSISDVRVLKEAVKKIKTVPNNG